MNTNKIIRSICYFTENPTKEDVSKLDKLSKLLSDHEYTIQTIRLCTPTKNFESLKYFDNGSLLLNIGPLNSAEASSQLEKFYNTKDIGFNIDLANEIIEEKHVNVLFEIIKNKPAKTFNFTYTFNNSHSSPYFPSATYNSDGFSIGLQPTDLAEGCDALDQWLEKIKKTWSEVCEIFENDKQFLGIDSSIAPIFDGKGSLVNFIKKLGMSFSQSVTTDTYIRITKFIKEENPRPIGLCGLMLPCLEDFELAEEYENGNFSIERNIFLSLHCGLGIDTYPIGVDENKKRVIEILKLVQGLSNKYTKPLSVRFVSDGRAKIDDKTDFQNQYLKDVVVKAL